MDSYFSELERELLNRFGLTFDDTGYERAEWELKFDCVDAKTDATEFGEKYDLIELGD